MFSTVFLLKKRPFQSKFAVLGETGASILLAVCIQFVILNTKLIIFNTEFIIFNANCYSYLATGAAGVILLTARRGERMCVRIACLVRAAAAKIILLNLKVSCVIHNSSFLIHNSSFFDTQFLVLNAKCLVLNAKCLIWTH